MVRGMDRLVLEEILKTARRHVSEGAQLIARQEQLIKEMSARGFDVSGYEKVLGRFEDIQRLHVQHVERLQQDLNEPPH